MSGHSKCWVGQQDPLLSSRGLGIKVAAILKDKDLTKLELNQLICSVITNVMITSNDEKKKKKDLRPKASPPTNADDEINNEEMAILSRKFNYLL